MQKRSKKRGAPKLGPVIAEYRVNSLYAAGAVIGGAFMVAGIFSGLVAFRPN